MPITRFQAVLERKEQHTPVVSTFTFKLVNGTQVGFKPGQFLNMYLEKEGKPVPRPYSISSSPLTKELEFCINRVPGGFASNYIHDLVLGKELTFAGPLGVFYLREPVERDILCIATGTGVGPMKSMIEYALEKGIKREIWLVFGVRTEQDIIYRERFAELTENYPNFHALVTLSRPEPGWTGETGYVQTKMDRFLDRRDSMDVYICGLKDMVTQTFQLMLQKGFPKEHVFFERYN